MKIIQKIFDLIVPIKTVIKTFIMDNLLPKLASQFSPMTSNSYVSHAFCIHFVPLGHLFGKPSSSSQACMDENGLVLQWRPTYWVNWLKKTRVIRNCWITRIGWFCQLWILTVTSIAISATAFGGKPEAITWKVKTIVGEDKKKFATLTPQLSAES